MVYNYCGNWENGDKKLTIQKNGKTYTGSFLRKNIGIVFNDILFVSEFDDTVQAAGVGVYSSIGDGHAIYALWSSSGIVGQLGSGIALKSDESPGFAGEYQVRYFVQDREGGSFLVKIKRIENENLYRLSWFVGDNSVLHGIGFITENSLAFAWGSLDCKFDFSLLRYHVNNGTEAITRQTVTWDSDKIETSDFIRG